MERPESCPELLLRDFQNQTIVWRLVAYLAPAVVAGRVALGIGLLCQRDVGLLADAIQPEGMRHVHLRVLRVRTLPFPRRREAITLGDRQDLLRVESLLGSGSLGQRW